MFARYGNIAYQKSSRRSAQLCIHINEDNFYKLLLNIKILLARTGKMKKSHDTNNIYFWSAFIYQVLIFQHLNVSKVLLKMRLVTLNK